MGELRIDANLGDLDATIQKTNEDRTSQLQEEADSAETATAKAQGSADRADKAANDAGRKAAAVTKEASILDFALDAAQNFSAARSILDRPGLKTGLEQFQGKPIVFRSYRNDGDAYFLCGELLLTAKDAGMLPVNQCGEEPFPDGEYPTTGVYVSGPDDDSMLKMELLFTNHLSPLLGAGSGPYGPGAKRPQLFIVFVGRKNDVHVGETAQTRDAEKRAAAMRRRQHHPQ